jgi:AcrR family transcriptional regulator
MLTLYTGLVSPTRQAPAQGPATPPPRAYGGQPAKRQAIIDAARRVFLRNGFTDTSVDAIAAVAGVSKQTIYNHFGDKERLFAAVVEAAQKEASPATEPDLADRLANSDDLDRDLRALGRKWVRLALSEDVAALRRLVLAERTRHPQLLDEWARPQMERALAQAIQHQAQSGALDVPDARLAARQLMLLIITESLTRAFYGLRKLSKTEADEIVDTGVDMWLRCYRKPPSR